jgi:hypothetical protein
MSALIETSGDIEIFCHPSVGTSASVVTRSTVPFFDAIYVGDRLAMVFTSGDGAAGPFSLKIVSPTGATIMDAIVRDLPTGLPQSAPPIEFVASARGIYRIEIREVRGRQRGEARVRVS